MAIAVPVAGTLRAASLFDVDPELAERLDEHQRAEARDRAIVAVADLPAGTWSPEAALEAAAHPFGIMVVEGLMLRELLLNGSTATELLGPCDIVAAVPAEDALLPSDVQWSVPDAAQVVILDDRLLQILRTWPGVGRVLVDRSTRREARLSMHRAIAQLPRVDQRLLAFFAHLAERWGRVASAGVVMPLHLTHETLGRLIGARRPTVSLALKDLAAEGLLQRRNDGTWLLRYEAFERLGSGTPLPRGWQPGEARAVQVPVAKAGVAPRPAPTGLSAQDIGALRARVDRLRSQHATHMSRCATTVEHSRAMRLEVRRNRVRRWPDAAEG